MEGENSQSNMVKPVGEANSKTCTERLKRDMFGVLSSVASQMYIQPQLRGDYRRVIIKMCIENK